MTGFAKKGADGIWSFRKMPISSLRMLRTSVFANRAVQARFIQPSRHLWQGALKLSVRSATWLQNGSNKRLNRRISDLFSTGVSDIAKLTPGTRIGLRAGPPVCRTGEPLDGIGCNSASICICYRRIIFLLCSTLVRWPVWPGRDQTGFCRLPLQCGDTTYGQKCLQQPVFPGGHPSKY